MKKLLALLLALSMMLILCACGGKSEAAQAVDDAIIAIGDFSLGKEEDIRAARELYDALSDSDKEDVENLALLEEHEGKLDQIYTYIEKLSDMSNYFTSYDFVHGMEALEAMEAELEAIRQDGAAWEHFAAFPEAYRRIRVAYIDAARKRPAEFEKRLANFIRKTREGKLLTGYGGIDGYYSDE